MIDIVTISCNDDPIYWEFWNPISKHWKQQFGIHPVLFYYGQKNQSLSEEHGTVIYHDVLEGVPDYVAATWGRFWVTKFFPNKMCLVSDIDMFPLSKHFFINAPTKKTAYTHLNSGAYHGGNPCTWLHKGMSVPVCYHLASSDVIMDVYGFDNSYEIELNKLLNADYTEYGNKFSDTGEHHLQRASFANGGMWGIDEMYSSMLLRSWIGRTGEFISSSQITTSDRLCRSRLWAQLMGNNTRKFIDFHSTRPYTEYKTVIHSILDSFVS